ncbi:MAG: phage major capsid protein [Bacteroidota bacterium]
MSTNLVLEAVKEAITNGKAKVNLKEASALTGSGSGVGGRVIYDDAFAALRYGNPLRMAGARVITTIGSDEAFVLNAGNVTDIEVSTNNPWGYALNNNNATTGESVQFWQIPVRVLNASAPIRTAVLSDVNYLEETIVADIALQFAQQEALSMMYNNDQSGSTTYNYGATAGLRGLNSYTGSTSAASFGSNGSAITNGLHTVLQVAQASATAVSYDDLVNLQSKLPSQYLYKPTTAWMMHPTTIGSLRKLKGSTGGSPLLVETGDDDGGAALYIFGHKVISNPYMQTAASGNYPVYLAEWERFVTIADREEMNIQRLDQTAPGFLTLYAEKRVVSTIRDVFAGVRLVG